MLKYCLTSIFLMFAFSLVLNAELRLPAIFSDHMVLQQEMENPIWGWAKPGAKVSLNWGKQDIHTIADKTGRWRAKLPATIGSYQQQQLVIKSANQTLQLSDILVGEVWLCSGQSNMVWRVDFSADSALETASAQYPNIRMITVPNVGTQELQHDFKGQWQICTPETVGTFSAVGYFFGRQLHQTLNVPIGLIRNAWGGSAAEAWIGRQTLAADPRFETEIKWWTSQEKTFNYPQLLSKWEVASANLKKAGKRIPQRPRNILTGQHRPGNLWAGVLNPIIGYGIRGTIWYQGESNVTRAPKYHELFSLLIAQWRQAWGQGDFPFYWVQLADYQAEATVPGNSKWAELREAQSKTLALPNTGQAVIYDIGEGRDIHPRNKQTVAKRLARIALARDYKLNIPYLSPSFNSIQISNEQITIHFKNVGSSLYTFDVNEAKGFAIAGEDQIWHIAKASLQGKDKVIVSSPKVTNPVAVRYAWANNPVANLYSREGLPVDPFRSDNWPQ